jgi:hypothetical protein
VNNCGTCKHWGSIRLFPAQHEGPGGQKRCGRIVDASDVGESELINEPAYTEDGDEYYSALLTKADFGCVLWEAKQ